MGRPSRSQFSTPQLRPYTIAKPWHFPISCRIVSPETSRIDEIDDCISDFIIEIVSGESSSESISQIISAEELRMSLVLEVLVNPSNPKAFSRCHFSHRICRLENGAEVPGELPSCVTRRWD